MVPSSVLFLLYYTVLLRRSLCGAILCFIYYKPSINDFLFEFNYSRCKIKSSPPLLSVWCECDSPRQTDSWTVIPSREPSLKTMYTNTKVLRPPEPQIHNWLIWCPIRQKWPCPPETAGVQGSLSQITKFLWRFQPIIYPHLQAY